MEGGRSRFRRNRAETPPPNQNGEEPTENDRLLGENTPSQPAPSNPTQAPLSLERPTGAESNPAPTSVEPAFTPLSEITRLRNTGVTGAAAAPTASPAPSYPAPMAVAAVANQQQEVPNQQHPIPETHTAAPPRGQPSQPQPSQSQSNVPEGQTKNDVRDTVNRLASLRYAQQVPPLSWFYCIARLMASGYDTEPLERHVDFITANPGVDIHELSQGYSLGMTIQNVQTYHKNVEGIVKPFVRVHIVDAETGLYMVNRTGRAIKPITITPRVSNDSLLIANWNDEILFDCAFSDAVNEKSVILFEIIDEQPSLSLKKNIKQQSIYKKVAWAFLLPIGVDGKLNVGLNTAPPAQQNAHTPEHHQSTENNNAHAEDNPNDSEPNDKNKSVHKNVVIPKIDIPKQPTKESQIGTEVNLRLQLHYYRNFDGIIGLIQRTSLAWPSLRFQFHNREEEPGYPHGVPAVFLQWKLLYRQPIHGAFLRISAGARLPKMITAKDLVSEGSESERSFASPTHTKERKATVMKRKGRSKEEKLKLKQAALRRMRSPKESCGIPDRFLRRLDVGPKGAMVVAFSTSGHLLAVASELGTASTSLHTRETVYSLHLYDTDTDEEIWCEDAAHHDIIYDIKWSKNDRYLLTSSGDGTCKIWDLLSFTPLISKYPHHDDDHLEAMTQRDGHVSSRPGLKPSKIYRSHPPKAIYILRLAPGIQAYCGVFQEFSSLNIRDNTLPNTMDITQWQDMMIHLIEQKPSRTIIGSADGRIRVFDGDTLVGYISVMDKNDHGEHQDFSPHDGIVNSIVIDERSKYLISADSCGDILAWRQDGNGWYQLLRKFRRENPPIHMSIGENFNEGSVLSLAIHPDKLKGLMLVCSRQPATLKVLNMATYKTFRYCEGFHGVTSYLIREGDHSYSTGIFYRASFSADGKYVICCCNVTPDNDKDGYRVLVWETFTGNLVQTPLSKLIFPYPIRNVAWHPSQHLIAVSMVGTGAAVVLYCTEKDSMQMAADRDYVEPTVPLSATPAGGLSATGSITELPPLGNVKSKEDLNYSILDSTGFVNQLRKAREPNTSMEGSLVNMGTQQVGTLQQPAPALSPRSGVPPPTTQSDSEDRLSKAAKAREILAKVRAAKESARQS